MAFLTVVLSGWLILRSLYTQVLYGEGAAVVTRDGGKPDSMKSNRFQRLAGKNRAGASNSRVLPVVTTTAILKLAPSTCTCYSSTAHLLWSTVRLNTVAQWFKVITSDRRLLPRVGKEGWNNDPAISNHFYYLWVDD